MLKIEPPELPIKTAAYLNDKTAELNALPYAEKVGVAKKRWENKHTSHFNAVRKALKQVYAERCHYCEDSIADEIEHIWPKSFYPELAFCWQNYLFSCGPCNGTYKNDRFALLVAGKRVDLVRKRDEDILPPPSGIALFIDSRQEDPMDYLELDLESGMFLERDFDVDSFAAQRARYTVEEVLQLNRRDSLVRRRKREYKSLLGYLKDYIELKEQQNVEQLERLRAELADPLMPTVWQEMIRSREAYPELRGYFEQAPELLE